MGQGVQQIPLRIPAQWDPKWFADFVRDVLAKADARNALGNGIDITGQSDDIATFSISQDIQDLLQQTYVLASPSGFLGFERVLAGESGVVSITDGGPNSSITVGLTVNGVPLSKIQLLPTVGVLGNRFLTDSQTELISPSAAGQALSFNGTTLNWTATPTWGGSHKWTDGLQLILGTGDDATLGHDGTDFHFENVTGDAVFVTAGDFNISGLTFTVATNGVDQFEIDDDGAWNIEGDPGSAGDVITSAGAGAPPVWAAPSGGGSGANITPDTHPASPNVADDEFETGTNIDTAGTRFSGATAWTWTNQGSATDSVDATRGNLLLNGATGADSIHTVLQAAPVASWRYRAKLMVWTRLLDFAHGGLVVYNSANTHAITFGLQAISGVLNIRTVRYSSLTTAVAQLNIQAITSLVGQCAPLYFEIENNGTNLIFRFSLSGYDGTFHILTTEALVTDILAVTGIGLYANPGGAGTAPVTAVDWFRRVA